MKTRQILLIIQVFLVFLAVVAVAVAVRLWPRTIAFEDCSEVYQRYAGVEGVEASFIKGFPLNDTVAVDVTLLIVTTDSAWQVITKDFNITPPPQEVLNIASGKSVFFWSAPKKDYSMPKDSVMTNNDEISCDWNLRMIGIFHTETEEQIKSIRYYNYNKSINKY